MNCTTVASLLLATAVGAVDLVALVSLGGAFAGIVTGNLVTLAGALAARDPARLATVVGPGLIRCSRGGCCLPAVGVPGSTCSDLALTPSG